VIRVTCSHRDPNARKSGRGNMLVKNLSETIDKTRLYDLFEKYENILSNKVIVYDDRKSEGCNFVQFESEVRVCKDLMVELLHLVVALDGGLGRLGEVVVAANGEDNGDLLSLVVAEGPCLSAYTSPNRCG